jgi:hypothetical protein
MQQWLLQHDEHHRRQHQLLRRDISRNDPQRHIQSHQHQHHEESRALRLRALLPQSNRCVFDDCAKFQLSLHPAPSSRHDGTGINPVCVDLTSKRAETVDDASDVSCASSSSSRRRTVRFKLPVDGKSLGLSSGEKIQDEEEQQLHRDQEQEHKRASAITCLDGLLQVCLWI